MGDAETGQVSEDAAKIYEEFYLPALLKEWCSLVVEAANIQKGHRVIDVACGTGALAITVSEHIGTEGTIVGIDINDGMLNIARSKSSSVEWLNAPAEALPFEDDNFNCAVSQFGLMYFENRENAIREMMRVIRPGGSIAVVVWDELKHNPGFAAENKLWQQVFGEEGEDESPNKLGDKIILENLFKSSGVTNVQITTHQGTAHFESIESWIHTGAKGWTDDAISDDQLNLLLKTAEEELTRFRTVEGSVTFPTSAHIVTARK
jgi:ubiquinone/menaquinone biosynthesis C-methylase UbiE